ncbi:hypothetical protein [Candidatus Protochlamydia naegleriophila]|nr:hypothetical protein [Candidatus Protochlamydia naegleriophila]
MILLKDSNIGTIIFRGRAGRVYGTNSEIVRKLVNGIVEPFLLE